MSSTLIHERVAQANAGTNPAAICRLRSGWAVLGDDQFLRGYCLLLPDPVVGSLNDLHEPEREVFLTDMAAVGDAVLASTGAARINYSILGNTDAALHAHVFARYSSEPEARRSQPVWSYPLQQRRSVSLDLVRDRPLMGEIRERLAGRAV